MDWTRRLTHDLQATGDHERLAMILPILDAASRPETLAFGERVELLDIVETQSENLRFIFSSELARWGGDPAGPVRSRIFRFYDRLADDDQSRALVSQVRGIGQAPSGEAFSHFLEAASARVAQIAAPPPSLTFAAHPLIADHLLMIDLLRIAVMAVRQGLPSWCDQLAQCTSLVSALGRWFATGPAPLRGRLIDWIADSDQPLPLGTRREDLVRAALRGENDLFILGRTLAMYARTVSAFGSDDEVRTAAHQFDRQWRYAEDWASTGSAADQDRLFVSREGSLAGLGWLVAHRPEIGEPAALLSAIVVVPGRQVWDAAQAAPPGRAKRLLPHLLEASRALGGAGTCVRAPVDWRGGFLIAMLGTEIQVLFHGQGPRIRRGDIAWLEVGEDGALSLLDIEGRASPGTSDLSAVGGVALAGNHEVLWERVDAPTGLLIVDELHRRARRLDAAVCALGPALRAWSPPLTSAAVLEGDERATLPDWLFTLAAASRCPGATRAALTAVRLRTLEAIVATPALVTRFFEWADRGVTEGPVANLVIDVALRLLREPADSQRLNVLMSTRRVFEALAAEAPEPEVAGGARIVLRAMGIANPKWLSLPRVLPCTRSARWLREADLRALADSATEPKPDALSIGAARVELLARRLEASAESVSEADPHLETMLLTTPGDPVQAERLLEALLLKPTGGNLSLARLRDQLLRRADAASLLRLPPQNLHADPRILRRLLWLMRDESAADEHAVRPVGHLTRLDGPRRRAAALGLLATAAADHAGTFATLAGQFTESSSLPAGLRRITLTRSDSSDALQLPMDIPPLAAPLMTLHDDLTQDEVPALARVFEAEAQAVDLFGDLTPEEKELSLTRALVGDVALLARVESTADDTITIALAPNIAARHTLSAVATGYRVDQPLRVRLRMHKHTRRALLRTGVRLREANNRLLVHDLRKVEAPFLELGRALANGLVCLQASVVAALPGAPAGIYLHTGLIMDDGYPVRLTVPTALALSPEDEVQIVLVHPETTESTEERINIQVEPCRAAAATGTMLAHISRQVEPDGSVGWHAQTASSKLRIQPHDLTTDVEWALRAAVSASPAGLDRVLGAEVVVDAQPDGVSARLLGAATTTSGELLIAVRAGCVRHLIVQASGPDHLDVEVCYRPRENAGVSVAPGAWSMPIGSTARLDGVQLGWVLGGRADQLGARLSVEAVLCQRDPSTGACIATDTGAEWALMLTPEPDELLQFVGAFRKGTEVLLTEAEGTVRIAAETFDFPAWYPLPSATLSGLPKGGAEGARARILKDWDPRHSGLIHVALIENRSVFAPGEMTATGIERLLNLRPGVVLSCRRGIDTSSGSGRKALLNDLELELDASLSFLVPGDGRWWQTPRTLSQALVTRADYSEAYPLSVDEGTTAAGDGVGLVVTAYADGVYQIAWPDNSPQGFTLSNMVVRPQDRRRVELGHRVQITSDGTCLHQSLKIGVTTLCSYIELDQLRTPPQRLQVVLLEFPDGSKPGRFVLPDHRILHVPRDLIDDRQNLFSGANLLDQLSVEITQSRGGSRMEVRSSHPSALRTASNRGDIVKAKFWRRSSWTSELGGEIALRNGQYGPAWIPFGHAEALQVTLKRDLWFSLGGVEVDIDTAHGAPALRIKPWLDPIVQSGDRLTGRAETTRPAPPTLMHKLSEAWVLGQGEVACVSGTIVTCTSGLGVRVSDVAPHDPVPLPTSEVSWLALAEPPRGIVTGIARNIAFFRTAAGFEASLRRTSPLTLSEWLDDVCPTTADVQGHPLVFLGQGPAEAVAAGIRVHRWNVPDEPHLYFESRDKPGVWFGVPAERVMYGTQPIGETLLHKGTVVSRFRIVSREPAVLEVVDWTEDLFGSLFGYQQKHGLLHARISIEDGQVNVRPYGLNQREGPVGFGSGRRWQFRVNVADPAGLQRLLEAQPEGIERYLRLILPVPDYALPNEIWFEIVPGVEAVQPGARLFVRVVGYTRVRGIDLAALVVEPIDSRFSKPSGHLLPEIEFRDARQIITDSQFSLHRGRVRNDVYPPGALVAATVLPRQANQTPELTMKRNYAHRPWLVFSEDDRTVTLVVDRVDDEHGFVRAELQPGVFVQLLDSLTVWRGTDRATVVEGDSLALKGDRRQASVNVVKLDPGPVRWLSAPARAGLPWLVRLWGLPRRRLERGPPFSGHVAGLFNGTGKCFVEAATAEIDGLVVLQRHGPMEFTDGLTARRSEAIVGDLLFEPGGAVLHSKGKRYPLRPSQLSVARCSGRSQQMQFLMNRAWMADPEAACGTWPWEVPVVALLTDGAPALTAMKAHAYPVDHLIEQFRVSDQALAFPVAGATEGTICLEITPGRFAELPTSLLGPTSGIWSADAPRSDVALIEGSIVHLAATFPSIAGTVSTMPTIHIERIEHALPLPASGAVLQAWLDADGGVVIGAHGVLQREADDLEQTVRPRTAGMRSTIAQDARHGWVPALGVLRPGQLVLVKQDANGEVRAAGFALTVRWIPSPGDHLMLHEFGRLASVLQCFGAIWGFVEGYDDGGGTLRVSSRYLSARAHGQKFTTWATPRGLLGDIDLLVDLGGHPWVIPAQRLVQGLSSFKSLHAWVTARVESRQPFVITPCDGHLDALSPWRVAWDSEVDSQVVAATRPPEEAASAEAPRADSALRESGIVVDAGGLLVFVSRAELAWADLDSAVIERLFPRTSALRIRLPATRSGQGSRNAIRSIVSELKDLREAGNPISVTVASTVRGVVARTPAGALVHLDVSKGGGPANGSTVGGVVLAWFRSLRRERRVFRVSADESASLKWRLPMLGERPVEALGGSESNAVFRRSFRDALSVSRLSAWITSQRRVPNVVRLRICLDELSRVPTLPVEVLREVASAPATLMPAGGRLFATMVIEAANPEEAGTHAGRRMQGLWALLSGAPGLAVKRLARVPERDRDIDFRLAFALATHLSGERDSATELFRACGDLVWGLCHQTLFLPLLRDFTAFAPAAVADNWDEARRHGTIAGWRTVLAPSEFMPTGLYPLAQRLWLAVASDSSSREIEALYVRFLDAVRGEELVAGGLSGGVYALLAALAGARGDLSVLVNALGRIGESGDQTGVARFWRDRLRGLPLASAQQVQTDPDKFTADEVFLHSLGRVHAEAAWRTACTDDEVRALFEAWRESNLGWPLDRQVPVLVAARRSDPE